MFRKEYDGEIYTLTIYVDDTLIAGLLKDTCIKILKVILVKFTGKMELPKVIR